MMKYLNQMKSAVFLKARKVVFFLLFAVCAASNAQTPYALWFSSSKTLYFTCTTKQLKSGDTFNGQYISNLWKGQAVLSTGTQPQWNATVRSNLKYVEIDSLFKNAMPTSTREWFYRCKNLVSIKGLKYLNTSDVTDMSEMFRECESLLNLELTYFKTENVTRMSDMFRGCKSLKVLDVSWFSTWQVETMSHMFGECSSLEYITFHTLLNHTFLTTYVEDMSAMFDGCSNLKELDLTEFTTGLVTNMSYMFSGCSSLKTLDLRNFKTSKVNNMTQMFAGCTSLETIKCNDAWSADLSTGMFLDCVKLHGDIDYDPFKLTVEYATPDNGYFFYYKSYPIYINGTQVDNTNSRDLTKISGVTLMDKTIGKATYNNEEKTLTLCAVRIDADDYYALRNAGVDGLKIVILENVNISGKEVGIMTEVNTTLTSGNPKELTSVNVNAQGMALQIWKGTTTIDGGIKASFNGGLGGIFGGFVEDNSSLKGKLIVKNGNTVVYARGVRLYSVGLLSDLIMEDGLAVVSPSGAHYQQAGGTTGVVVSDGTDFVKNATVIIKNPDAPVYGINILGKQVNSKNYTDLSVIPGVDVLSGGYANYNPSTNTLNLKNTVIYGTTDRLVECDNHNLKIHLEGSNRIYSSSNEKASDGLCIYDRTTLTGNGSLQCYGGNIRAAVYLTDTLIVENVKLQARGYYGIYGQRQGVSYENRFGTLVMKEDDGRVVAYGTESCIHHLTNIIYGGDTDITMPEGAFYNFYDVVERDGTVVKGQDVVIETPVKEYGIQIAGIELTNRNREDITRLVASLDTEAMQRYQSGKMKILYSPAAKLLTLKNAVIRNNSSGGFGIYNKVDGLMVYMEGDNLVESKQWTGFCNVSNAITFNDGTLTIKGGVRGMDFDSSPNSMRIDDCKLTVEGSKYGIDGGARYEKYGSDYVLREFCTTINIHGSSSVVRVKGGEACYNNLKDLILFDGLHITSPAGVVFGGSTVGTIERYFDLHIMDYLEKVEPAKGVYVVISSGSGTIKGDVNLDGEVDISDIVAVINTISGNNTYIATADVNADGNFDISDVVAIINVIAGK